MLLLILRLPFYVTMTTAVALLFKTPTYPRGEEPPRGRKLRLLIAFIILLQFLPITLFLLFLAAVIALILPNKGYTYKRGNSREKPGAPKTFLTWNVSMLLGGLPIPFGGVIPSFGRIGIIAGKIRALKKDFVCLEEVSPNAAFGLYLALKDKYAHFYFDIDPDPLLSLNSGLFIASKMALTNATVIKLPTNGGLRRAAITFKSRGLAITGTHLESGDSAADIAKRREQLGIILKRIPLENSIFLGDLNMDRDEFEKTEASTYFNDPYDLKKDGPTTTDYFTHLVRKDVPPVSSAIDYILISKPETRIVSRCDGYSIKKHWANSDHHPLFTKK